MKKRRSRAGVILYLVGFSAGLAVFATAPLLLARIFLFWERGVKTVPGHHLVLAEIAEGGSQEVVSFSAAPRGYLASALLECGRPTRNCRIRLSCAYGGMSERRRVGVCLVGLMDGGDRPESSLPPHTIAKSIALPIGFVEGAEEGTPLRLGRLGGPVYRLRVRVKNGEMIELQTLVVYSGDALARVIWLEGEAGPADFRHLQHSKLGLLWRAARNTFRVLVPGG